MKSVIVHGVLALLGLAFAYQTWTRKPDEEPLTGEVSVSQCALDALQEVKLDTPTHEIVVQPQRDPAGTHYWVTVRRKDSDETAGKVDQVKKPADQIAEVDATKPAKRMKGALDALAPKRFLAKPEIEAFLKRLAPLRAARALGVLPKDKFSDFGFDNVGTSVQVRCGGQALSLEFGSRTFGSGERYARDVKSKQAFLLDDTLVSDLQAAQFKFMQTQLHSFVIPDVDTATVEARGVKKELLHRDRQSPERATWVDAAQPAHRNDLYANWFARVGQLRIKEFLAADAQPGADLLDPAQGLTPVVDIHYTRSGLPDGKLELVRVDVGSVGHYYARTETTGVWVSLFDGGAKDVEQDVALVVGLDGGASSASGGSVTGSAGNASGEPAAPATPAGH